MSRQLVALVGVALVLFMGVAAVNAAFTNAGPHFSDNETFTPDSGNVTDFGWSGNPAVLYDNSVQVRDENGTLMREGADYEWFQSNGTLLTLEEGRLAGDTTAEVDAGWTAPDEQTRSMATLLGHGLDVSSVFVFVLGIGAVLGAVRVFRRVGS